MRKSVFYLAFLTFPVLFSCNQGGAEQTSAKAADSLVSQQCFVAVDGADTANLNIKTLSSGKISGDLVINFKEKGKNDGKVEGKFAGDTLFVDYTFKIGMENKTIYKNPLAFLRKDGKLVLGVGQIQTTLGRSYFVKGKPISFEKGRFTFAPVDCKK